MTWFTVWLSLFVLAVVYFGIGVFFTKYLASKTHLQDELIGPMICAWPVAGFLIIACMGVDALFRFIKGK